MNKEIIEEEVHDEWVLFRTNEITFSKTKEKLLNECNLHAIVSLPGWVLLVLELE